MKSLRLGNQETSDVVQRYNTAEWNEKRARNYSPILSEDMVLNWQVTHRSVVRNGGMHNFEAST